MDTNNQKVSLVVCSIRKTPLHSISAEIGQVLLWGSSCLEAAETSECCAFPGSYDGAITTRVKVDAQWDLDGICQFQSRCG